MKHLQHEFTGASTIIASAASLHLEIDRLRAQHNHLHCMEVARQTPLRLLCEEAPDDRASLTLAALPSGDGLLANCAASALFAGQAKMAMGASRTI